MALLQDIRFAARLLIKDRWFTLAAVTALALGTAVNAVVFTLVNAVLLRGLPFPDPRQIVAISTLDARGNQRGVSITDFEDLRAGSTLVSDMALVFFANLNVSDDSGQPPDRYSGPYISSNIFRILGQQPMLGRNFTDEDDRPSADPVMMLGYGIWKTRYGGDPSIVGKTLKVNGLPLTVVGVMPEDMKFPPNSDLWIPFSQLSPGLKEARRDARTLQVIGRIRPGVTVAQARAEFTNIGAELSRRFPDTNRDQTPSVVPSRRGPDWRSHQARLLFTDGRGGLRVAHRLRERRQPAAGAFLESSARDQRSRVARRHALARSEAAAR